MSRKFNVFLQTVASATVPVTLTDADLAELAANLGTHPANLTHEDLRELLMERAYDNTPTLGVCCTGGRDSEPSLELSDVWESSVEGREDINAALLEVTE